jgi:methylated-DNA-[protein]-cysteine S-methyltransferase
MTFWMEEKVIVFLQRKSKYVAGVFSSKGLYATCLPRDTIDELINELDGFDLPESRSSEYLSVLESVFDIYDGKPAVDLSAIEFDFSDLTPKQVLVYKAAMNIPYGRTMPYGIVAENAGLPGAARFVGNVMASNRFAPLVPCHRVVSSTGIGGFTGGIERKLELLRREGVFAE